MKYHLILSIDYELFGNGSGCIEKCIVDPTERCRTIVEEHDARLSLFVETLEFGCFSQRTEIAMKEEYLKVESQLRDLMARGHNLELHIHPQWQAAERGIEGWNLAVDKWRIGDLDLEDVRNCVQTGLRYLDRFKFLEQKPSFVFRAGGWAIQPSETVLATLSSSNFKIDSTVAPGLYNPSTGDWYDFRHTPNLPYWRISNDVCKEDPEGELIEVPIATEYIGAGPHIRALKESKSHDQFPDLCIGSYAGPNNKWQTLIGRMAKFANLGVVMLDFSTLPAWALIEVTQAYMKRFEKHDAPVPIVAIGHNKNFSRKAEENLAEYLSWANNCPALVFSDYRRWQAAMNDFRVENEPLPVG